MASYSAMPAGSTGYSTPRSDVGQTGYSGQYPNASAATQVAASPAGSYHPGSVKEYKPAGVQSPYQSQTAAIPATYPGAGYTTGNAYDAGGMAPPAAASTSPTGYSGSYPTYPTTGGYAAPANGQAPSYTPNAPGTNYPSVGVNGSISAGGTVNR